MSQKGKLQEIYQKLKLQTVEGNNPELDAIAEELRTTIEAMDADDGEGGGGGNHPPVAPNKP